MATPGKAVRLELVKDCESLQADGTDVMQMEAVLLDAQGNPAADETLHCQILGDLALLGLENGTPDDLTPYREAYRATREGSLTVYLRAGCTGGNATVRIWSESGIAAETEVKMRKE